MQFVKAGDLKMGMRLARPIYNRSGVLLFERNSLLSKQAIESVHNFGLLGVYILEPAEPLPPMSEEDLEFERFQIVTVGSIQEELNRILTTGNQSRTRNIADMILRKYGHLNDKLNFYQNLRSHDDYVSRHSLNVAILCAMISHMLNMHREEQLQIVSAAIVHDIARLNYASDIIYGDVEDGSALYDLYSAQVLSADMIESAFATEGAAIRRICVQAMKMQLDVLKDRGLGIAGMKLLTGSKILMIANRYDELTAMKLSGTTQSEIKAIKEFLDNPQIYDQAVVSALIRSINILFPGVSVELNTGDKALILTENPSDILRPTLLNFRDNNILDLSHESCSHIHIVDIMKTLDNRYIMDKTTLRKLGYDI